MLTEDMKDLCEKILELRKERGDLMNHLAQETQDRSEAVAGLCKQFAHRRVTKARRAKHERLTFLHHLKRTVSAERRAVQSDLAGVRKAWAGRAA